MVRTGQQIPAAAVVVPVAREERAVRVAKGLLPAQRRVLGRRISTLAVVLVIEVFSSTQTGLGTGMLGWGTPTMLALQLLLVATTINPALSQHRTEKFFSIKFVVDWLP